MNSLLERCFGNIGLAKRWIAHVRERHTLRGKVEMLERHTAGYRETIRRDVDQIAELVATIKDLRRAQRTLPREVVTLLETAKSLMETVVGREPMPSFEFHTWLGEYRAFRSNEQRGNFEIPIQGGGG